MDVRTKRTELPRSDLVPQNDLIPPGYGSPQRKAIDSMVEGVVADLCDKISILRKTLDEIEQHVLEGASFAKSKLKDHVTLCVRVNDEITHMREVIAELKQSVENK
jgi:hypothetical protein